MEQITALHKFAASQDADHAFKLGNGDLCVVLHAPVCGEFHEWHYYLLLNEDGLRVVRRHKILPDVYPTKVIDCEGALTELEKRIITQVADKVVSGELAAMPDCNKK